MIRPLTDRLTADEAVAALAAVAAVAGSSAAAGFTPVYVVSPIERLLSRTMPGFVVTLAIERLGSVGQTLNLATATVLGVAALAVIVRLGLALGRRVDAHGLSGLLSLAFVAVATLAVALPAGPPERAALSAGGAVAGAALVLTATTLATRSDEAWQSPGARRRQVLAGVATTVGVGGVAAWLSTGDDAVAAGEDEPVPETAEEALRTAEERSLDVSGIEPLVSEEFFSVDINAADPSVDREEWSLTVTGEVEAEVTLDFDDVESMASETRFVTLRCVGDRLNGKKMDNALWTGVPVADVLERAGVDADCDCVVLRAADDYFVEFPLSALEDGLLAYRMNGEPLPRPHGHPVRVLVPGHWGETNVKWLTEIEVLDEEMDGYWERRGWSGTGPVSTVAKLHEVTDLAEGRKRVAGHAYAGTRGVSAVEVSTDGDETWTEARLSESLPGNDVWRQWAHEYDPPEESHEVVVRAIEADGTVQPREESDPFPSGASGWVSQTVE